MEKNKKILDTFGYYTQFGEYYYLKNCWNGRIILNEDNSFEGIAADIDHDKHYILFGDIFGGIMNTYVICNKEDYPRFHKGVREDAKRTYFGRCYATEGIFYLPIGESKIIVREAEKNRSITDEEFNQIKDGITLIESSMNVAQHKIYESLKECVKKEGAYKKVK